MVEFTSAGLNSCCTNREENDPSIQCPTIIAAQTLNVSSPQSDTPEYLSHFHGYSFPLRAIDVKI